MSSGRSQSQSTHIAPPSQSRPTRPPVDHGDAHTTQMFQTLLPSMSPNRVDLPTYFVKTNPAPRPNNFMRNLLKYGQMVAELRAFEAAILQHRLAILDMEKWLLAQESQMALVRGEDAQHSVEMVETTMFGDSDFPGPPMFQPYPNPKPTSFAAQTQMAYESLGFKPVNAPNVVAV